MLNFYLLMSRKESVRKTNQLNSLLEGIDIKLDTIVDQISIKSKNIQHEINGKSYSRKWWKKMICTSQTKNESQQRIWLDTYYV